VEGIKLSKEIKYSHTKNIVSILWDERRFIKNPLG
jgi:hypothetical protein